MPKRRTRIILALVLFFLIFLPLFANGVDLLVDWLWFKQEGFRTIYWTILKTQIQLSGLVGVGFMVLTALNLLIAHALAHRHGYRVNGEIIEFSALDRFGIAFRWLIWLGVLLIGYVIGQWGMYHWLEYQMAGHGQSIGQHDPLFGIDLGFYLFRLPFNWFLYHLALIAVIVFLLSAAFLYLVEGGVWVTPRGPKVMGAARAHLMVLAGLLFVVFAYRVRLAMYGLLFSPRGLIYGAGYADVHATLPVLKAELFLCLLTAVAFVAGAKWGRVWPAIYSVGLLVAVAVLGGSVYPEIVQRFIVAPNEIDRERPYIANAIEFTRQAYA